MIWVLAAIGANLMLVAAALGFGSLLGRWFPQTFSRVDRIACTLLGGLGLLGTLLFCIGMIWFSRTAILLILLFGVLLCIKFVAPLAHSSRWQFPTSGLPVLPVIVVATVLLITAIGGLADPTGDIKMDTIAYHYLGPKVWLREGVIRPVLDECQTAFPAIVETQYGALMALGRQRAPDFFALPALLSFLLVSAALALRAGLDYRGSWWVVALIASMPVVHRGAYGGFIDVVYAGFVLAALRVGLDAEQKSHYALFGMFCGLAMGAKYPGLLAWAVLTVCILLIATPARRLDGMLALKYSGIACAVAIAVAAPWYIRNWVLMGSPIYPPPPLLPRFFHIRYLPPQAIQFFHERQLRAAVGMGRSPLSYLLLPFNLTYHTAGFLNGAGGIGLAPLALGPLGVFAARRDWFVKGLGLYALLQTTAWFVTYQEARYLMPVYPVASIFAVLGWQYVNREGTRFARVLSGLVVACSILYGLFMIGRARVDDVHAVMSSSFAETRRHEEIPFVDSFGYLNSDPSVTKVLILDRFVPPYYSDKAYIKPVGRWGEQTIPNADDLSQILSEAPRLHVSHVLDVRWEEGTFQLPENPEGLTLVFQREDQRVYRLN
jgi:hypothetical protein